MTLVAPYPTSITITREVYKKLYPNSTPRFVPVVFRGNPPHAEVDNKIGKYILENYDIIKKFSDYNKELKNDETRIIKKDTKQSGRPTS